MPHHTAEVLDYSDADFSIDLALVLGNHEQPGGDALAAAALERIVLGYKYTIIGAAQRLYGVADIVSVVDRADLHQVGVEGVYDGLSRADPSKHPRQFHSYVGLRIFDAMFAMCAEVSGAISLSEGGLKKLIKVRRIAAALEEGGDFQELLEKEGLSATAYDTYSAVALLSTPSPLIGENVVENGDTFPVQASRGRLSADAATRLLNVVDRQLIAAALDTLTDREQYVAMRLFGFDNDGSTVATQDAVGKELGVTESRINQIKKKLLEKLRVSLDEMDYFDRKTYE